MPTITGPFKKYLRGTVACVALAMAAMPARAEPLAPQTRIRLTIVQWMPMTGQYEQWGALSGELIVSADGRVSVPLIGSVAVGDMEADELATEVAVQLQRKMGLVAPPDASIEVLDYPPIYVVGSVTQAGEYKFRPGMTVLQALALGGGQLQSDTMDTVSERIRLRADLEDTRDQILRSTMRLARLQAEFSGADQIEFPEVNDPDGVASMRAIQEQAVFEARGKALDRQFVSLTDLGKLYQREIEVLEIRVADLDHSIATAQTELEGVQGLVERGVATVARRSELERTVSDLRSARLDQLTAIMRANQYMSEADRNMAGLGDQRRVEVSQDLVSEQASLEQLLLQEETMGRLLRELDRQGLQDVSADDQARSTLTFSIVRSGVDGVEEIAALEATTLMPGDVVKVSITVSGNAPAAAVPQVSNVERGANGP